MIAAVDKQQKQYMVAEIKKSENNITYLQQNKRNQNCKWAKNSSVMDTSAHFFGQHNQMIKCR